MVVKLKYKQGSFCGPVHDEEIEEYLDIFRDYGYMPDENYLDHIMIHNGGIPQDSWFPQGQIERFLNFSDSYAPPKAWYKDLNVNATRSWISNRVPPNIVPFATMPHGAFLCFRYAVDSPPDVVMWNNESFKEQFVLVAQSFSDFTKMLQAEPKK